MEYSLIWLRRSTKRSLKWLRRSMKRSIICLREFMQLALRNDPVVLEPESITLLVQGISLKIPSQQVEIQMTVPNFEEKRFHGMAECLRRNCEEFKQKIVKEMAAQILAFFIQPQELGRTLSWTRNDHKKKSRKDEELELIRAHRANRDRKISRPQRLKYRAYFV
ncbi:hypothetical protein MKW92_049620 [Papaver armeniacum]|nr:hypothetical protein MKW92_049620 [Papaver armeniacum]